MKLKIRKKSKRIILLILILLLILSILQLLLPMMMPKTSKKESIIYEATCEPKVSYQVFINPNEVFSAASQKEGEFYSKRILNHIQADFEVNYLGSEPVPLDIEYQILATVNGFQGENSNKANYWSKDFPISNKIIIKEKKAFKWSKKERVNISLGSYDSFAVRAKEITGMDAKNEVVISMKGKIIAHTKEKDLETPINANIQIPLMEDVFKITKGGTDPVKDNVTAMVDTKRTVNLLHAIPYGSLLILCIIGIIALLFFSREPNEEEILMKKVNSVIKNYGSRIVALQSIPKMTCRQHYKVHSMKDLIKIADELQKPIFYETDKDTVVKNYEFHIIEDDILYSLFLDSPET